MTTRKYVNGTLMRYGYTTGSCAAAAAKAALSYFCTGVPPRVVSITTLSGKELRLIVESARSEANRAVCAVKKDAGDDPDVTDGVLIFAEVRVDRDVITNPHKKSLQEVFADNIIIDGGEGIGRVTKPGLDQPVGAAAINSGPRAMIRQAVLEAAEECGLLLKSGERIYVTVFAPEGAALAKRTFNSMLGIEGGISILGTTGIVEPMSNAALVATIEAEVSVLAAEGHKKLMINLGNYGENFVKNVLAVVPKPSVKCSNFIDAAMDAAVASGMEKLLIVGHIGKLVKLGIAMFNTHSNNGDGRLETMAACAAVAGADGDTVRCVLNSATTEAALQVLENAGLADVALNELNDRIRRAIARRMPDYVQTEFICFGGKIGEWRELFASEGAYEIVELWKEDAW